MTPENYISTDPGSEQDFVDKRIGEIANAIAEENDRMMESMIFDGADNRLTGIIGAVGQTIHENLMIDWDKLENPER